MCRVTNKKVCFKAGENGRGSDGSRSNTKSGIITIKIITITTYFSYSVEDA
jgi:hypothetical protein